MTLQDKKQLLSFLQPFRLFLKHFHHLLRIKVSRIFPVFFSSQMILVNSAPFT